MPSPETDDHRIEHTRLGFSGLLVDADHSNRSVVTQFLQCAFYSGIQTPLEGVTQVVDRISGSEIQQAVRFINAPDEAEFLSKEWFSQQAGTAAGMLPWLVALHKGSSCALGRVGLSSRAGIAAHGSLSMSQTLRLSSGRALESGLAGCVMGGVLSPVSAAEEDTFWSNRLRHSLSSGVTFSTLAFSSTMIGGLAARGRDGYVACKVLVHPAANQATAGLLAGVVHANSESLLAGKGVATVENSIKSATTFGLLGAGFWAVSARLEGARLRAELAEKQSKLDSVRNQIEAGSTARKDTMLNVGGRTTELSTTEMSNFEHSPFELDGRTFASVEAFYVWLKWSGSPEQQAKAAVLHGAEAKKFGRAAKNTTVTYEGSEFELGSPEHHALVKRAIRAKLEQNPGVALRFAQTYPRPIIHDLGYPESPKTKLPAADFSRMLTELRQELIDGKLVTRRGTLVDLMDSENKSARERGAMQGKSVSELLQSPDAPVTLENHPVGKYAAAMESSPHQVTRIIKVGGDSVVMEMVNGDYLKLTARILNDKMGTRPFDLHILERGSIDTGSGVIYWFIQPAAISPVSYPEYMGFKADIAKRGYVMNDGGEHQLGRFNGAVKLLDPFAVERID